MNAARTDAGGVQVRCFAGGLALGVAAVSSDPALHAACTASWLNGAEQTRAARFAVAHARADFLAGRIAAKCALRALVPALPAPAAWEIRAGEHQQPLVAHVAPGLSLSIAHAGGVGLAVVHGAPSRCGIDLELADRDAGEVIATQVAPSEAVWARAGGGEERTRWLLLWTAREAQGKSFGTGLLEPERLAPTEAWTPAPHGWRARFVGDETLTVRSVIAGDFVVTLVLPESAEVETIAAWLARALV